MKPNQWLFKYMCIWYIYCYLVWLCLNKLEILGGDDWQIYVDVEKSISNWACTIQNKSVRNEGFVVYSLDYDHDCRVLFPE